MPAGRLDAELRPGPVALTLVATTRAPDEDCALVKAAFTESEQITTHC